MPACLPEQLLWMACGRRPARISSRVAASLTGQGAPQARSLSSDAGFAGKLVLAKSIGIGSPALDQWNGLQRLDGRAREDRASDVAKCEQQMPLCVGDGDGTCMAALDEQTSGDLDEDGVAGGRLVHDAAGREGPVTSARARPVLPRRSPRPQAPWARPR